MVTILKATLSSNLSRCNASLHMEELEMFLKDAAKYCPAFAKELMELTLETLKARYVLNIFSVAAE